MTAIDGKYTLYKTMVMVDKHDQQVVIDFMNYEESEKEQGKNVLINANIKNFKKYGRYLQKLNSMQIHDLVIFKTKNVIANTVLNKMAMVKTVKNISNPYIEELMLEKKCINLYKKAVKNMKTNDSIKCHDIFLIMAAMDYVYEERRKNIKADFHYLDSIVNKYTYTSNHEYFDTTVYVEECISHLQLVLKKQ